jgi:hypothetical protein
MRTLTRRHFLGAGLGAMGLAAAQQRAIAQSGGVAPSRFVFIYTPAGREPSWRTDTPGSSYTLGPTMTMFEPFKDKLILLDGVTTVNFGYEINAHLGPVHCMLGGKPPLNEGGDFGGNLCTGSQRTFDHLLADRIGVASPVRSIVIGGLDTNHNQGSQSVSWTGPRQVQLPLHETDQTFAALFAGSSGQPLPSDPVAAEAQRLRKAWEKEVLGLSQLQTSLLKTELGSSELMHLQAYEANLNEAFQRASAPAPDVGFVPPAACNGLAIEGLQDGLPTEAYARHHDLQSRTLAAALACGRTRVATYVMASHLGSMTVPGGVAAHHHHDDSAIDHYRAFDRYYGDRIAFLLQQLASYPEGDGTLLDHTIIVWSSDISWTPVEHDHERHPLYLLGGLPENKLKMGQYVKLPFDLGPNRVDALKNPSNRRIHEVLLTIAGAMGITDLTDFADPEYVQGPVAEILS